MNETMRAFALALCGAALAAAPAMAQHSHGGGDHSQHAAGAAQQGPSPMMALHHKAELNLSADQQARLEQVHAALRQAHREHCERMQAAGADHQAMHAEMTAATKTATDAGNAVLTAQQRATLAALHAAHHGGGQGEHAQHASMQHGQHAEHGDMQHAAGSDDCEAHCCKDGKCDEEACLQCCDMHRSEGHGAGHAHSHG